MKAILGKSKMSHESHAALVIIFTTSPQTTKNLREN
jgi:hypothetical protein